MVSGRPVYTKQPLGLSPPVCLRVTLTLRPAQTGVLDQGSARRTGAEQPRSFWCLQAAVIVPLESYASPVVGPHPSLSLINNI